MNPILDAIKYRRSVYPKTYTGSEITKDQIRLLLEAANAAPNHKLTEPWRFKIFYKDGREVLSTFFGMQYRQKHQGDSFSELKYKKILDAPLQSAVVMAVVVHFSGLVPQEEEVCAVACSVQNMLLAAYSLDFGAYWSTGNSFESDEVRQFLGLALNERCLGWLYVGKHNLPPASLQTLSRKITWIG
jgi:Nitroreductase